MLNIKARLKSLIYNQEKEIYLPLRQDAVDKYLRGLIKGNKIHVKCSELIIIKTHQYNSLNARDLIRIEESKLYINNFYVYSFHKENNREWICRIINTLVKV